MTPEKRDALPDPRQAKRTLFLKCFCHVKTYAIIFHKKTQTSIGRAERNVYSRTAGMLSNVVEALLN
jgi:hypothetical protein